MGKERILACGSGRAWGEGSVLPDHLEVFEPVAGGAVEELVAVIIEAGESSPLAVGWVYAWLSG